MNATLLKSAGIAAVLAIGTSGCSNLTPGENAGVFGALTGVAVGVPLAAAGVDPSIGIPITLGAAALAATTAYIVAKHQADEEQRRIAEARARLYMAKLEKQRQEDEAEARRAAQASASKPKPVAKKPRYIAVETEKGSDYKGKTAVMIYDTQSEKLVGNDVYDLKSTPKAGTVSKYDSVQAQYVGAGT
jgi:hypothetical protein